MSRPARPRLTLIVNPAAGGRRRTKNDGLAAAVAAALSAEWTVTIAVSTAPGAATALATAAAAAGVDFVAVLGGDGTLNEVVAGLMAAPAPRPALAPLGGGSGNDFAAAARVPPDPITAATAYAAGAHRTLPLDVGWVECVAGGGPRASPFINVASVGASAGAASRAPALTRLLGARVGYATAAAVELVKGGGRVPGVEISVERCEKGGDDPNALASALTVERCVAGGDDPNALASSLTVARCAAGGGDAETLALPSAALVAVANGSAFGGGLRIAPCASPHDGALCVLAARGCGVLDFAALAGKLRAGRHVTADGTPTTAAVAAVWPRAARARVTTGVPAPVEADGQVLGTTPASVWVEAGALRLVLAALG